uniref:Uncharacterized protein n=1 Tax=Anguilla anguilla TaxID=7936 RepID=A0A0E9TKC7_ANGAN
MGLITIFTHANTVKTTITFIIEAVADFVVIGITSSTKSLI